MNKLLDGQLAHGLARFGLGINFAVHGLSRIPMLAAFTAKLQEQFAPTALPPALVTLTAHGIVAAETVLGLLLVLGLAQRVVLVGLGLLMAVLIFGTCLVQNWTVAGDQLVYLAFIAGLLAMRSYDRFSVDGWRRRKAGEVAESSFSAT